MTTRITALQLILENPMREDDAQSIIDAVRLIRGVIEVRVLESNVSAESAAAVRRDIQWADRIRAAVNEQLRDQP
ncbi:hypothetical protein [Glycomyces sp. NPDC021274]|uniref:hypothetical protein n=1 Tax=Glycomyces sp. NPDC021274 TaxID=3155120 RepID=UPI0033C25955